MVLSQNAWDALKKLDIEEKLQKLGVEPGSGNSMPHIHAPHGRAASVRSKHVVTVSSLMFCPDIFTRRLCTLILQTK